MRTQLCQFVLNHAIQAHIRLPHNVGFLFGGDANCMRCVWNVATIEDLTWQMYFGAPEFIFANEYIVKHEETAKDGDIGLVMGIEKMFAKQYNLNLQSREAGHDVLIIGWTWLGRFPDKAPARHAGASEHGDEPHAMPVQLAKR